MKEKYDQKKLKEYEVKILDYFVSICEKYNLDYYLAYGTLLGAVRHKGFIPWDDDIDVYMKPSDYYKFKEIMLKENNDKYFYQSLESEKYYYLPFAKIRMNNTLAVEKKTMDDKIHKGIYIDIFPLIPYPNDNGDKSKLSNYLKKFNLLVQADMKDKTVYNSYGKVGKILSKVLCLVPRNIRNVLARRYLKKMVMYDRQYGKYICIIDKKIFDRDNFEKKGKVSFEGKKYNSPKDYDKYLKEMYGDYMTLPKEEDRITHNFIQVKFDD